MSHEHGGVECHIDHEQHIHQHPPELHQHLGSLCCAGQCNHIEHIQAAMQNNQFDVQHILDDDEELDEFGNKKKKKDKFAKRVVSFALV